MIIFYDNNSLFEAVHGGKYYTLCTSIHNGQLANHVSLKRIPTKQEAKLILDTLHFPKTTLQAWEGMEQIKFADES